MEIVFVHLNSRIPLHLYLNLRRTKKLFPEYKVILISNFKQRTPKGTFHHYYKPGAVWQRVEASLSHPREYRNNFWMTSMARFLALMEYQKMYNIQLLHVESDVILASDFPLRSFERLNQEAAFPVISPERGVASILYLRDSDASEKLTNTMLAALEQDPHTSDMLILGIHFLGGNDVCVLPIGPEGHENYRDFTAEAIQVEWRRNREQFKGIFDGADVGIYYFGTDPRNSRGTSFLQLEIPSEYGIAKQWNLQYGQNRNFIDFLSAEGKIPLYCLHVTSKQLRMFQVRLPSGVIKKRIKRLNGESKKFYIRVGLIQFMSAIRRRVRAAIK